MTPIEISKALREFRQSVGARAECFLHIDTLDSPDPISLSLYPFGMLKSEGHLNVRAAEFSDAIKKVREAWDKYGAEYRRKTTQKMALAVIRLTDEFGECTDAALRDEFDAGQIAKFGADACALAGSMATKGPFSITRIAGANAA